MSKILYDQLQKKMDAELEQLKNSLIAAGPQAVIDHAEELAVKAQLTRRLESAFLAEGQIKALLGMEQPLEYMFENQWDGNHSSVISLFSDLAFAAGEAARKELPAEKAAETSDPGQDTGPGKYEITDIAHPHDPYLHRIRALRDVGRDVHAGDLGGYVQTADNLSQEGSCWLFGDAIACEDAQVGQGAQVSENAVIRGSALVSGTASVGGNAVVEDQAIVMAGTVGGECFVSGNAVLASSRQTDEAPSVAGRATVYGKIYGAVLVSGTSVILPGIEIDMPTLDVLEIRDGQTMLHRIMSRGRDVPAPIANKARDGGPER